MPAGSPANATVNVVGNERRFTFDIPRGETGISGADGSQGETGPEGAQSPKGQPGEVSFSQLDAALAVTSANSNGVDTLSLGISEPPTQAELQPVLDKLNELILALLR